MKPRWDFNWPIPKYVQLPGARVKVQVGPRKFNSDGAWVYDVPGNQALIVIDEKLPLEVQRYTLLHELQHAMVDVLDQGVERFPEYVKTKLAAGYVPTAEETKNDAERVSGPVVQDGLRR